MSLKIKDDFQNKPQMAKKGRDKSIIEVISDLTLEIGIHLLLYYIVR